MTRNLTHKFQEPVSLTYEQHFRLMFTNFVDFLRTLEDEIGKERLQEILASWSHRRGIKAAGDQYFASLDEFKQYWKSTTKQDFFAHVITVDFPEENHNFLQCNYTECLWAKTFKELDAVDYGKIMACDPDFPLATTLSPNLRLERTKTLMEGDDCCDHRFIWKADD